MKLFGNASVMENQGGLYEKHKAPRGKETTIHVVSMEEIWGTQALCGGNSLGAREFPK
jgi:hypothetical protein